ncbi:autotransporter strand-loop-strand O-heptosyltransferase [Cronobacter turicensis]|uniref:Autotransporter strand-loop-strand O-heptosyltransferase n=2 Tax=Cronobacter turicensis TaxID=413502 RepID=A0A2T7B7V5_9ENTR|nr:MULTISPECIES: autotransporter strand-loop-strand O-heptosyltransferase [Cronobacter]MEB8539825.1 autotransporter strand-loop-strand O-heptosyltransferase [Cronobacter sakazakii]EGT4490914.1 autotransporter strand-loop-strand O-heptosyltransferase [Cronobacter turicensis]EKM0439675.1 autotransporter strand-loop-strand O-heptosyltransferase [Cronobacter turicensis]EKM0526396.1 autotransporter strand-loop-strand O-heptosyltransferase [Cronobacter turicensis]EKM0532308.1 autotransporter strand-
MAMTLSSSASNGYAFILPPEIPTQQGPEGILYDFNDGARLLLPAGDWRVEISDDETGNILFASDIAEGWVISTKKYYVPFRLQVWKKGQSEPLFDHALDMRDKPVLISFPTGTLGDLVGWVPYAERFRQTYGCQVECTMAQPIIDLFAPVYPELQFYAPERWASQRTHREPPYATWRVGLFFQGDLDKQPFDFRAVGLHRTAGHILGVDPSEIVPDLRVNSPRQIAEPYVCIATQSTSQAKFWNNGSGWHEVIDFLKAQGYRVLCIDKERVVGRGYVWNKIPHGVEDFTGNLPLRDRVALLEHAEFFIGLGSGLSWLAWGCRIPVVLISGFSLPASEFYTPWRVINTHVCNGCWDDVRLNFDHQDYFWCPRHKGTDRQYECTRFITGKQVIGHLRRLISLKSNPFDIKTTALADPNQHAA